MIGIGSEVGGGWLQSTYFQSVQEDLLQLATLCYIGFVVVFYSYDYVRISTDDQTIGTYCGQQSGHSILVTGHYAEITFHSDGSVQHRGYELFFSHVPFGKSGDKIFYIKEGNLMSDV